MSSARSRHLLAASLAMAMLYAAPLYFPPATVAAGPPPPDASLLARLFPGVPAWWIGTRLLAAAAAIVLAFVAAASASPLCARADFERTPPSRLPPAWTGAALGVAAVHATASWWAADFGRVLQIAYFVLLGAPAALLAFGQRRQAKDAPPRALTYGTHTIVTFAVVATWLVLRFATSRHSARATDLVDGWDGFDCLVKAAHADFNVVVDACYAGYTALPLIVQGAGILGAWLPLSFEAVQLVHLGGIAACAAIVAYAASELLGAAAAPVAAAIFLFAPFELMVPLWPAAPFVFALYTAALVAAAVRFARHGSAASLAAFGALAGIACRCPPLLAVVPLLAVWMLGSGTARARSSAGALGAGALSFYAGFAPSLGEWSRFGQALASYGHGGRGSWSVMEAALFGQFSPQSAEAAIGAASPNPLDVPLGLLLAPLATPRTALRLWGDTLLDPVGAVLTVVGLGVVLRAVVANGAVRMLIGLLVTALLPGALAGYDRVSLTRVAAVAVPLALLGAAGFQAVQRTLLSARVRAIAITAPVCAAIAVSGTVLFDAVNPAILARSPLSIALGKPGLETLAPVVLEEILWKPHYTRLAAAVPSEPLRVATHADLPALLAARSTSLIVWSPGEEEDYAVSRTVCRAWPDAALYELRDAASLTRAFAASPQRVSAWPEEARDCDAEFETEVSRAERALARSARLADEGRLEEAAAVVEAQARRTFGDAKIFDATARALLAQDPTRGDVARAVEWASRGCEASGREEPLFCRTLADAHAARGNSSEALRAARVAKDAALSRGQEALAAQLELRIQGYARRATGR